MRRTRKSSSKRRYLPSLVLAVATCSGVVGTTVEVVDGEQLGMSHESQHLRGDNGLPSSSQRKLPGRPPPPRTQPATRSAAPDFGDIDNVDRSSLLGGIEPPPRGTTRNASPTTSSSSSWQKNEEGARESQVIKDSSLQEQSKTEEPPTCRFLETSIIFWHLGATTNNGVRSSSSSSSSSSNHDGSSNSSDLLGTAYVLNNNLLNSTLDGELSNSYVSGVCTRTQLRQQATKTDDSSSTTSSTSAGGGGYCRLTYTLTEEMRGGDGGNDGSRVLLSYNFNAAGEVFDSFGGTLAVAGGTGTMVGVSGEVRILPYNVDYESGTVSPSEGDVFLETDLFLVKATLFQNSCLRDAAVTSSTTPQRS